MHRAPRLTLTVPNKAARRVIAPYVKVIRKKYKAPAVPESKLFKKHLERKPSVLLRDLTSFLSDNVDLPSLLHESADVLKVTTHAHGVSLYIVETATGEIYQSQRYFDIPEPRVRWKVEEGTIVAAYVASKKELVMIEDILQDERFPMGIGQKDQLTKSVLCVPVVTPDGDVYAVIELFRDTSQDQFEDKDMKIATLITGWMGAAIYQNLQRVAVHKKQELNDYLLSLTKVFLEEFVPTDKMVSEMVKFVKLTLASERSSFYLLDRESEELVADIYEKGIEESEGIRRMNKVKLVEKEHEIVASVAKTGMPVNIKDAFTDPKIGKEIDDKTGFIVRSVLCVAVKGENDILGVIEVVNKKNGCFTKSDEILFDVFATYFALVLQFSNLHEHVKRQEKMNELTVSLLNRQVTPCIHDYNHFMKNLNIKLPSTFAEFKWYISEELVEEIPLLVYAMIREFAEPDELDVGNLGKFILSIRKFGRTLPYHNFEHAFDFCHTIYCILKRNEDLFTPQEIIMMFLAGIGHCIDRTTTTNEFLELIDHEIYQLFPMIPWQNYHALIIGRLLEQFPIYASMPQSDYKRFVSDVKDYILRCDLRASFFAKCARGLKEVMQTKTFSNSDPKQHDLLIYLVLACGDMGCFSKQFLVARKLAEGYYQELHEEGEKILEKRPDCILLQVYDKNNVATMPEQQIAFLNHFVLRILGCLKFFLPNTVEMYNLAL
ncbi:cAMP and cAMP-inhibited cGMP 3',5'-cyclic phosphodiesterase 10A-like [Coccinella septempunctata]|uniref:cAMP and cAMP-inhibited cGMP 3',5'-cyclic phosphodiesterase 10A-like n=1 Tax=Coccinella septempunctata TaxID=41139 RepID=UPI001D08FC71|nr:cAMP and cAMP-inhibited cGMP 3',5'-cyclic phosphodiesterase 10A-like [Coccinella septempunctata]